MTNNRNWEEAPLTKFIHHGYSQNGEEGIILEVLRRLSWDSLTRSVVEFGAWDGKTFSNTFRLVQDFGFRALYIESDPERFLDLEETSKQFPKIVPVNEMVSRSSESQNSLENIILRYGFDEDLDVLSIDIDSFDLDIWESLNGCRPKVVIIEINSGIMPGILSRHNEVHDGNSFSSTIAVAKKKQYTLVAHVGNLIFVRDDLVSLTLIPQRYIDYPELLFSYRREWLGWETNIVRLTIRKYVPIKIKFFIMQNFNTFKTKLFK